MPNFSISWNTAASSNGAHTVYAVVTDLAGNQTTSSTIAVTADNVAPSPDPIVVPPPPSSIPGSDPTPSLPTAVIEQAISLGALFYNTLGEFSTYTVEAVFSSITDPDTLEVVRPPVPVIDETIGFSEFIQIIIQNSGGGAEGVEVYYLPESGHSAYVGLRVTNTSADPRIRITRVEYHAAASDAGGFAPGGSLAGSDWDTGGTTLPTANFPISAPFSYNLEYSGAGGSLLYTSNPGANAIYNVPIDVVSTATLNFTGFSATDLGVTNPSVLIPADARGFVVYIDALGRTVFKPLLPGTQGAGGGYFGFFAQIFNQPITATISVTFSTGFTFTQVVQPSGGDSVGCILIPTEQEASPVHWELEDYFLFISESSFSNDLDSPTGRWEDMLDTPPDGVFVTALARFHEIISTTINGIKLDPETTYYYRVGSRRTSSLATTEGTYVYSETLSEEATGQLSVAFSLDEGDPEPEPVTTNTLKQAFVWGQAGTNRVEQDASFPLEVPADCVLEKWYMDARMAGTGSGTLTVNVRRNGTDLFSGASIPSLAVGVLNATGTTFSNTTLAEGDQLRFDVRTVHTGQGSRVKLELIVRQTTLES